MPLTDTDREILDAWGRTYMEPARRVADLERSTGLSPHMQGLRLTRLIDTREALEYAPATVNRLRRLRGARRRGRSARAVE